jgi:hypothetical protein
LNSSFREKYGVDTAGGRWTQISIGKIALNQGDVLEVFLWRRIPTPVPPRVQESDYQLGVVVEWRGEQFAFDQSEAEKLANELPDLLRIAARFRA